ncbi:hypothetical protein RSSM_03463 [Rhodopirellula sallentina SM41]|uniref:Uncharacterized protein n=1 Tax=Rhodopirellula sallentina SM41 TaxID=1263870 RepID=M5U1H9_9BACT|nr:hypothetical protein RSSM_03463 [Rhodopirellula sallentina SM41]
MAMTSGNSSLSQKMLRQYEAFSKSNHVIEMTFREGERSQRLRSSNDNRRALRRRFVSLPVSL